MSFLSFNWLKAPADRDIIRRWTRDGEHGFALDLPQPPDPRCFAFLALGDTGDSESEGRVSPQDAVAGYLAEDAAPPCGHGAAELVLHLGDVVYMTGERRLYDRNFRRPYAPFLTPESTLDNLVFRLPFLPVPGNHDYYDFAAWARFLVRTPLLGSGVRALARELFAYRVPRGGSGMGKTFMDAFVGPEADGAAPGGPAPAYRPGEQTRIPNRYYRFHYGCADFFALDSNTLEPPPPSQDAGRIRREAARRARDLETRARVIDRELKRDELALQRYLLKRRTIVAAAPDVREQVEKEAQGVHEALLCLDDALLHRSGNAPDAARAAGEVATAGQNWARYQHALEGAETPDERILLLSDMERCAGQVEEAARAADAVLAELPEGPERTALSECRQRLTAAVRQWRETLRGPLPPDLCQRLRVLSEASLDNQRELTRERRRMDYRPDDFDHAQLQWLDRSLQESIAERPDAWRIVFLHHPLYTTTGNHCEHPDVQAVRDNLLEVLKGRVHVVLSGHSHAFEWIHTRTLPETGLFVTGGGGQVSLRRSILAPERFPRFRGRYESLRQAGALESAHAGRGPAANGSAGPLYHFLRVEVTPQRLLVRPVGVRRLRRSEYRREEPMPVYHVPELTPSIDGAPVRQSRLLKAVEIRRGHPPRPFWVEVDG